MMETRGTGDRKSSQVTQLFGLKGAKYPLWLLIDSLDNFNNWTLHVIYSQLQTRTNTCEPTILC